MMKDDKGNTPLHLCLEFGSTNCMKMLVNEIQISDDSIRNNDNWRPSDVAKTVELAKFYKKYERRVLQLII